MKSYRPTKEKHWIIVDRKKQTIYLKPFQNYHECKRVFSKLDVGSPGHSWVIEEMESEILREVKDQQDTEFQNF